MTTQLEPTAIAEDVLSSQTMNGAEQLVHTLIGNGVDVCFANPGTSEMHFVAALDSIPGMRCVLGLFEGVVTGAADGYYRMAGKSAATLLHLGPGLANGLAGLHNAKKAGSGIVNIVGDHATGHLKLDAPLTSDIAGLATPMSHWVRSTQNANDMERDGTEAVAAANGRPGKIATLILPADTAWSQVATPRTSFSTLTRELAEPIDAAKLEAAARAARHGESTLLLLGAGAVRGDALDWAGRIAAATGCAVMSEFYIARAERGAGRVSAPRLPYAVDPSLALLKRYDRIILVGARPPVAFFAYPGKPGVLSAPGCELIELAGTGHDHEQVLRALCEEVGGLKLLPARVVNRQVPEVGEGAIDGPGIGRVLARLIPENGIVVDESLTTGRGFDGLTASAAPHDWLTGMGGAIGFALPVAVGAAIASPGRRVLALEGDGSGMYSLQSLWTMVRESLDVTVLVFANRAYRILRGEFENVGAGAPGPRAADMLSLERPELDWVALASGMGMPAARVDTLSALNAQLARAVADSGPSLIEVILP